MANHLKFPKLNTDPRKFIESVTMKPLISGREKLAESTYVTDAGFIIPKIEAIHAGATRNDTIYPAHELKGDAVKGTGVYSWVRPYPKPVIYNHDTFTEATGRVMKAVFSETTQAGRPGIILYPKITSPDAIQAIKDGRLMTVSIGGESSHVRCNICHTDIAEEGFCGHYKGEVYDDQLCQWIIGEIKFDEVSWVNVPADSDAMVVDTESSFILDGDTEVTEATNSNKEPVTITKLDKSIIVESNESINFTEALEDKETNDIENSVTEGVENLNEQQLKELATMVASILSTQKEADKPKDVTVDDDITSEDKQEQNTTATEDTETTEETETDTETETSEDEETKETAESTKESSADDDKADESTQIISEEELAELHQTIDDMQEALNTEHTNVRELSIQLILALTEGAAIEELSEELNGLAIEKIQERLTEAQNSKKTDMNTTTERKVTKVQNPAGKATEATEDKEEITKEQLQEQTISFLKNILTK